MQPLQQREEGLAQNKWFEALKSSLVLPLEAVLGILPLHAD